MATVRHLDSEDAAHATDFTTRTLPKSAGVLVELLEYVANSQQGAPC